MRYLPRMDSATKYTPPLKNSTAKLGILVNACDLCHPKIAATDRLVHPSLIHLRIRKILDSKYGATWGYGLMISSLLQTEFQIFCIGLTQAGNLPLS